MPPNRPPSKPITADEIGTMPSMVRWFDPGVLLKILKPVVISGVFGSYADRRLIQAALDPRPPEKHFEAADFRSRVAKDKKGQLWVDFIADTGDGFASSYTIAWLQSQPKLEVEGQETERGGVLLLGGDQVYPDATYKNYNDRFKKLFDWAFPDNGDKDDSKHPPVFAIPGNHDWYDGLALFLAFFCKAKPWKLGNWRAFQRRSYFAVQITDVVWVWGIDIQLTDDVDSPQAEYFSEIASRMNEGSRIIMMTAVPGWYDPQQKGFGSLGYLEKRAHKTNRGLVVPLVLSGDVHHYARYECGEVGTQFITCGGGGAFLHPTHMLRQSGMGSWGDALGKQRKISLANLNQPEASKEEPACYPSKEASAQLLSGLAKSPLWNWKFGGLLGSLYGLAGLSSLMWNDLGGTYEIITNYIWLMWGPIFVALFLRYADSGDWMRNGVVFVDTPLTSSKLFSMEFLKKKKHWLLGVGHGLVHALALLLLSWIGYKLIHGQWGIPFWTLKFNVVFLVWMLFVGGFVAGGIFSAYLYVTCRYLGLHANDAFSIQSLDSYRGFLRICISNASIIIYPIGVDSILPKQHWVPSADLEGSRVIPDQRISTRFIEKPIVIPLKANVNRGDAA